MLSKEIPLPSPSGLPAKWPGVEDRAKLARIYHRPINSNFLLKIIGHVPVLLGHFDYANGLFQSGLDLNKWDC